MTDPNPNDPTRVHIWVSGRVQGVGFRAFVQQSGMMYGLTGWVKNVGDDQVETVAEGPRETLERFVEVVRNGPRMSRVELAHVDWETPQGDMHDFRVKF